jgi:ABC-type Zn2+ transport system substrate-binding protein/surface adhesin
MLENIMKKLVHNFAASQGRMMRNWEKDFRNDLSKINNEVTKRITQIRDKLSFGDEVRSQEQR